MLANELTELINELGPKIWDDFDNVNLQTLFSCSWIAADLIMTNSIVSSSLQPACRLHPASLAYGGGRAGRVASMLKETTELIPLARRNLMHLNAGFLQRV